jgi:hypothetical protein
MTVLTRRSSRLVWCWCVAYTAIATPAARQRRRDELRSHHWESERAALTTTAVVAAAARGVPDDVFWACSSGLPRLVRSFGTPTPYVALAPAFPIQAWVVSALSVGTTAHLGESIGMFGGMVMLAIAGIVWLVRRRRG